jgi:hypothetical protein
VFYYGYWVKAYDPPADTLLAKKFLIEALTRRLFNHLEHGINVPGKRLEEARRTYEAEADPQRKRVKGAMLAGALFNRATDIFTKLVEMQALGVRIAPDDALMRTCGQHLEEALSLGRLVLHRSGEEGLDELWGEPFKAFVYPIEEFYKSRYVKIALTMEAIDRVREDIGHTFANRSAFAGVEALVDEFGAVAKLKCETLRTDPDIFDLWTAFVCSAEKLAAFRPSMASSGTSADEQRLAYGVGLIREGKDIISYMARARVPMPKTVREFGERCERYRAAGGVSAPAHEVRGSISSCHP